jgi:hypothetical protein
MLVDRITLGIRCHNQVVRLAPLLLLVIQEVSVSNLSLENQAILLRCSADFLQSLQANAGIVLIMTP